MSAINNISSNSELPHYWEEVQLQDLLDDYQNGFAFSSEDYVENGIPIISMGNISLDGKFQFDYSNAKKWKKESLNDLQSYIIEKGDVIIAMTDVTPTKNLIGRMAFVSSNGPFLLNQRVGLLRINEEKAESKFVYYVGNTKQWIKYCKSIATQGAQANISTKDIKKGLVLLPPKNEQQKIAEILSNVDEKIEVIEEKISKTQELKKGLMQRVLTRGIGHNEFKESSLGSIPKTWEVKNLASLGEFSKGKGISKSQLSEKGLPCIRYGEIYTTHHFVIKQFHSFIDEEIAKQSQPLSKNDLLFAGSGETVDEIGKCVAYLGDEEAYAGGDIIILSPTNADSLYLSYCLNSDIIIKQRRKFGQGNAVVHIYAASLGKLMVPMPPKEEQKQIARIFSLLDNKIDVLEEKRSKFLRLKQGLMQQLLTGKIRVNSLLQKEILA